MREALKDEATVRARYVDVLTFERRHSPTHSVTIRIASQKDTPSFTPEDFDKVKAEWLISLNRCYLGRSWEMRSMKRMTAEALTIEFRSNQDGTVTAKVLAKAPDTADHSHFAVHAAYLLKRSFARRFARGAHPSPSVTIRPIRKPQVSKKSPPPSRATHAPRQRPPEMNYF